MANDIRLFFALWPNDDVRHALVQHAKPLLTAIQNPIKAANLHLTLAFIGNVDKENLSCYMQAADAVQAQGFQLQLDRSGCFLRAKMLWLGCSSVPHELTHLLDELNTHLEPCGYHVDKRSFTPHVSLARKWSSVPAPRFNDEIIWPVDSFSLIESCSVAGGVEYRVLQSWPLG